MGEMLRTTSTRNEMTTLANKFLINCPSGAQVSVDLIIGQVSPGPTNTLEHSVLSFTVFHYNPPNHESIAWSVYRSSNWTAGGGGMNPFTYDRTDLNIGNVGWSSNEVTIRVTGDYYVYVSGGAQPNNRLGLTVQRNSNSLFGVYRTATTNGHESLGYGAVVRLQSGERLKVIAEPNTEGFGTQERHTSFFGFLIV